MTILENILLCCVYLGFFIVLFTICVGILWILEKIGFMRWLRGWLWYFGFIEECPDTDKEDR